MPVVEDESWEQATGTLLVVKQVSPGVAPHTHTSHAPPGSIVVLEDPAFVFKQDRQGHIPAFEGRRERIPMLHEESP